MAKSKKTPAPATDDGETIVESTTATAAAPKRTKGHKARFITELLERNADEQLDDTALAAKLEAEYPGDRDWLKVMPGLRGHYNAGKFTGQACPPAERSVRYVDGAPAVRRVAKPTATPKAQKSKANAVRASKPPVKMVLKKKAK